MTANAPLFQRSHTNTVTRGTRLPCTDFLFLAALQGQQDLFAFSVHLAPTRCNLSSFREQLKLKEDLNSAIYILFRLYWHVSTHTVKIKSPAEPIRRDQCVPILKAKHSRLCQVKIRAKHFILLYFQLLLNIVKQQKGKRFQLCTKSLCSTTSIYAL